MRIPRICVFDPLTTGMELALPEQAGEHLARVLRLERGHPLVLFNGDGREYRAEIAQLAKRAVTARVLGENAVVDRESPLALTLVQGIARGEKMDLILQKATELGVARIVPVITDRTEVKLDAERTGRRLAHWQAVIAGACEQCGRSILPMLDPPQRLVHWAGELGNAGGLRLALDPDGEATPRSLASFDAAMLVVGPEGGLSDNDMTVLDEAGFTGLRLGPRILRTETAGLAAIAALQALYGDL
ncbi:MAG TPA: 16S rRNA (uracil(1498)-N(3))-methyltransferase [Dokdonella sp.]|uniref:16S rRNA (uracil(1498)-N(3))-methyltransferase n=1 Tax=Dokdonella sp. TaxID=2291710 RepID=UPI0025C67357|nr:16S rRNA (uracil(1498)-N(3))-methyltransferase [Dokdonella sp.]MBX3690858.1 16S rRNA (uracil(1498)-N(3))-methyltransferase [Dokdonella sp.]MCW5567597.1 16S rRNA (uracil(1498)-N(3))-methyltransferase [Dokdonella sp.]HNR92715.1 16S rRNA (uracil(1498)-N(3))-methyltransferase [Dokdonella sp.]